jgi:hypothetical protein
MRPKVWSAVWFRLFLSHIVVVAVFSSPLHVVTSGLRVARRPARASVLQTNLASVHKQLTGFPGGVHRVRFLDTQEDPKDEMASQESALTWTSLVSLPLTECKWPSVASSLPSVQSTAPLRC